MPDPTGGERWADAPWWGPLAGWLRELPRPGAPGLFAALDAAAARRGLVNESGLPVRFVPAGGTGAAVDYERRVAGRGEVATRRDGEDGWHDWFNAIAWLAWPRTKARLNRLQRDAIATERGPRGPLRDAITLFDENAVLLLATDPGIAPALRAHRWQALFVDGRAAWRAGVRVLLLGHGLMQRMRAPYPSLTAKAWCVLVEPSLLAGVDRGDADTLAALDARVARGLAPDTLATGALAPLPVLGVPGWWPANEQPSFYNDPRIFRPPRPARPRDDVADTGQDTHGDS